MREEAKGCKEIQHCIEPAMPAGWHPSHVAARVAEVGASAALPGNREQFSGVVETVNIVSGFGQQVRVPSLPARNVENAGTDGESEQVNETRRFLAIPLGREEQAVLQEIVGVESRLPPLARFTQKKTGSRYAPKTVSIAARIS